MISLVSLFYLTYNLLPIFAQGGTTSDGDYYVCVPVGFCNNLIPLDPDPGIDPRIVVPSGNLCPSGSIPCFTQGPASKCGVQFIVPVTNDDGISSPGSYPWQAYLQNSTHSFAGSGALIDNYHIITAAHKVENEEAEKIVVMMGVENPSELTDDVQTINVATKIIHPDYNPDTLINDIAILRLQTPISLSQENINTVCLPSAGGESLFKGQRCSVSGWGQSAFETNDAPTNSKKQVSVDITGYEECSAAFSDPTLLGENVKKYLDPAGEICAGGEAERDACSDGGSPLVCPDSATKYTVAGLVIWGKNCGRQGVYGVYVYVPAYRTWIDETLETLNNPGK